MKTNKIKWMAALATIGICSIAFAAKVALTPCQTECKRKSEVQMNICQHVAPSNKVACVAKAIQDYNACMGRCN